MGKTIDAVLNGVTTAIHATLLASGLVVAGHLEAVDDEGTAHVSVSVFHVGQLPVTGTVRINQRWVFEDLSDMAHRNFFPDELTDELFKAACDGEWDWSIVEQVEDLARQIAGHAHDLTAGELEDLGCDLVGPWATDMMTRDRKTRRAKGRL
jgi:hypothetical protein